MSTENQELRKAGLKVTLPRVKILQILESSDNKHMSAEDVYKALIDGDQEITLLRPGEPHVIQGSPGDIVSLIPIRGDVKTLTTSGLEYPLQRGHLPFGATLGVSNIMTASEATISLQEGLLICIVLNNITRRQK